MGEQAHSQPWLVWPHHHATTPQENHSQPTKAPTLRLFCFPHAGGGVHSFPPKHWCDLHFGEDVVETLVVSLPGRGVRQGEIAAKSVQEIATAVVEEMKKLSLLLLPFAFFGHSLGSILAFETSHELKRQNLPIPFLLFASAHHAPQNTHPPKSPLHTIENNHLFLEGVAKFGGIVVEDLSKEMENAIVPALRADMMVEETYEGANRPAIDTAIVGIGGSRDSWCSEKDILHWKMASLTGQFELKMFDGSHFYTVEFPDQLHKFVTTTLQNHFNKVPLSICVGPCVEMEGIETPLHKLVERFAVDPLFKKNIAVVTEGSDGNVREYSYENVLEYSKNVCRRLQGVGARHGDIIGVFVPRSLEYIVSHLSIYYSGGAIFPIETNYTKPLISELVRVTGCRIIISMSGMLGKLPERLMDGSSDTQIVLLDDGWESSDLEHLPEFCEQPTSLDDIAFVTMTSGSTGTPKAVINTHRGGSLCFAARQYLFPYNPQQPHNHNSENSSSNNNENNNSDSVSNPPPDREGVNVFFVWEALRPLCFGVTAVVIPDSVVFDPKLLVSFLHRLGVTRVMVNSSLLAKILEAKHLDLRRLLGVRQILLCGEVVPQQLTHQIAQRIPHLHLINIYSTWESLDVSHVLLESSRNAPISSACSVGVPMPHVTVYVLGEDGRAVRRGAPGEVFIESPGIGVGYVDDPVKTNQKFVPNPFCKDGDIHRSRLYRSGDQGVVLPNNEVMILGRIDSTIKIRAFKISLTYIEHTLSETAGISSAAATAVLDDNKQPRAIAAFVVPKNSNVLQSNAAKKEFVLELRKTLQSRLPEYAVPQYFVVLEDMPQKQGESRKLDRASLPDPLTTCVDLSNEAVTNSNTGSLDSEHSAEKSVVSTNGKFRSRMEEVLAEVFQNVLSLKNISRDENFFEIGGHSLLAATVVSTLQDRFGIQISVTQLYQNPTISSLAAKLSNKSHSPAPRKTIPQKIDSKCEIAVVGMSGMFPGAKDIDQFWKNLLAGKCSVRRFEEQELALRGVPETVFKADGWVPCGYVVDGAHEFDSYLFGISKSEATVMDPQHRKFLECSWKALESSGHAPRQSEICSRTGVFGCCGIDGYLVNHLEGGGLLTPLDPGYTFTTEVGSEKDYVATRVAFQLNLQGPSLTITSACSSALVCISIGCSNLIQHTCDLCICGGSALSFPNFGYLFAHGLVGSRDGVVRPFDEEASGTVFGDSVGAVVLRRLDEAIADHQTIFAVIRGHAISNDGREGKVGYTAPSSNGQATCIANALQIANLPKNSVSYVECHATATLIGDAIETQGLRDGYSEHISLPHKILLGSVKGNIGHANCAAGITGLIKTILCLHNKTLVPTANLQKENPKLMLGGSPFALVQNAMAWTSTNDQPLCAGVSSFGIGGTNCHVVLQEPPKPKPSTTATTATTATTTQESWHVIRLSAKTQGSLVAQARDLLAHLRANSSLSVAQIAFTLAKGRCAFAWRFSFPALTVSHIISKLQEFVTSKTPPTIEAKQNASAVYCISGMPSFLKATNLDNTFVASFTRLISHNFVRDAVFQKHVTAGISYAPSNLRSALQQLFKSGTLVTDQQQQSHVLALAWFVCIWGLILCTKKDAGVVPLALWGNNEGEFVCAAVASLIPPAQAMTLLLSQIQTQTKSSNNVLLICDSSADEILKLVKDVKVVSTTSSSCVLQAPTQVLTNAKLELDKHNISAHFITAPQKQNVKPAQTNEILEMSVEAGDIRVVSASVGTWVSNGIGEILDGMQSQKSNVVSSLTTLLRWEPDVVVDFSLESSLIAPLLSAIAPTASLISVNNLLDSSSLLAPSLVSLLWLNGVDANTLIALPTNTRSPLRIPLPTYVFDKETCWRKPEASIYCPLPPSEAIPSGSSTQTAENILVRFRNTEKNLARGVVYCFAYAGGSSAVFRDWALGAPFWLDVVAVEHPGRGGRADEYRGVTHGNDLNENLLVASAIANDAQNYEWFAVCGLSMGALCGIEVCELLKEQHNLAPQHFVVVGRAPPATQPTTEITRESIKNVLLTDENDKTSSELFESYFLPLLLGDLHADSRAHQRIHHKLKKSDEEPTGLMHCGLHVICGSEDASFSFADANLWKQVTSAQDFKITAMEGTHSFIVEKSQQILGAVVQTLSKHVASGQNTHTPLYNLLFAPLSQTNNILSWPLTASQNSATTALVWRLGSSAIPEPQVLETATRSDQTCVIAVETNTQDGIGQCLHFVELCRLIGDAAPGKNVNFVLVVSTMTTQSHGTALVVGASKSIAHEFPEIKVSRVFVDDHVEQMTSDQLLCVAAIAQQSPHASDLWLHKKSPRARFCTILSPKLVPVELQVPKFDPVFGANALTVLQTICGDENAGMVVVTGGTGGVGSIVVDWMIDSQHISPSRIVLLSRTAKSHPRGCIVVQADCATKDSIASNEQLRSLVKKAPLIVHMAGVIDDGIATSMDRAKITKVVEPKVHGLDELVHLSNTMNWETQLVVCFSSTSSLFGFPGQINYSAANTVFDHTALFGSNETQVVSICWGPWGEAGMAAAGTKAFTTALQHFDNPLPSPLGLKSLESLLTQVLSGTQHSNLFAVCDVDWQQSTTWKDNPLISTLAIGSSENNISKQRKQTPSTQSANPNHHVISEADQSSRGKFEAVLRGCVSRWELDASLISLGVDSLDAVHMRREVLTKCGVTAPLSVFTNPAFTLRDVLSKLCELQV